MVDDLRGSAEEYGGAEPDDVEPERFEQQCERAVELEAPATSAVVEDLGERISRVDGDVDPPVDVEVLERHRPEVGELKRSQRVVVDLRFRGETEVGEVPVDGNLGRSLGCVSVGQGLISRWRHRRCRCRRPR